MGRRGYPAEETQTMESDKHYERLKITAQYAKLSNGYGNRNSGYGCRVAATIWIRNQMVAWGVNSSKTSPMQKRFGLGIVREADIFSPIYVHAEIAAISRALSLIDAYKLKKANIYVARLKRRPNDNKQLLWGLARPCSVCMGAILEFNIRKVYWTLDEDKNGCGYEMLDVRDLL